MFLVGVLRLFDRDLNAEADFAEQDPFDHARGLGEVEQSDPAAGKGDRDGDPFSFGGQLIAVEEAVADHAHASGFREDLAHVVH